MTVKKDVKNPDIEIKIKGLALSGIYFTISVLCVFLTIFVHKTFVILMFALILVILNDLNKKEKSDKNDTLDKNTNNTRNNNRSNLDRNRTETRRNNIQETNTKEN